MLNTFIVIDANIWVSYILTKNLDKLISIVVFNDLTVFASEKLYAELDDVLFRPKFKKYLTNDEALEGLNIIMKTAHLIEPTESHFKSRDPKDNYLLDFAYFIHVEYLVSNDKDLLSMQGTTPFKIINKKDFEKIFPKI